jgi:RNA polymerase sigma-70 factor, ECF subfamily
MSDHLNNDEIHPFQLDRAGFNDLFRKHFPSLKTYGCLFVDADVAEDIVQDVFIKIWETKETLIIHSSPKAYLFKAVYTRCLNHINRQKMLLVNHQQIESEMRAYEASFFDPDKSEIIRELYMNELRTEINQAIESLPQKCREVFTLSYLMDMKNKEISDLLDISVSTVEKHINHALRILRQLLSNKLTAFILVLFM